MPLSGSCRRYEPGRYGICRRKSYSGYAARDEGVRTKNLRTVKVNEDFINEELYEQVLKGKVHVKEKTLEGSGKF